VTNGYLDDVDLRKVKEFEQAFLRYMADSHPELVQTVASGAKRVTKPKKPLGKPFAISSEPRRIRRARHGSPGASHAFSGGVKP
jgi:hypothetical protein